MARRESRVAGVLSEFGMALVLVGLCVYFSWATWGVQFAEGAEAAREVLREVPAEAGGVLVVGQQGRGAEEFVSVVEAELRHRGQTPVGVVRGEPQEVRAKLDELGGKVNVVVGTHEVAEWRLVRGLTGVRVIAPREFRGADFLKASNLSAIGDRIAVIAIIGIGMTMVILTGGIDLSVGSLIALAAVVATRLIRDYGGGEGAGAGAMWVCSAAAVAVCAVVGLFSGTMVTVFRVPPFIVTLAMMLVASGLAYEGSRGESIAAVPESFVTLGRGHGALGVPNTIWLMGALYVVAAVAMARTAVGRYVYAIGSNREGAFYAAVPVRRVITFAYMVSGALAGLGGIVEASRLRSGSPTYGLMAELSVIAAVVVGGTSLNGGKGSVMGTLVGALIIAVIENGMNLTGVGSYRQKEVLGLVILGAVMLDQVKNRRRGVGN